MTRARWFVVQWLLAAGVAAVTVPLSVGRFVGCFALLVVFGWAQWAEGRWGAKREWSWRELVARENERAEFAAALLRNGLCPSCLEGVRQRIATNGGAS